ncbi:MAG TPA: hypothetical protein VII40_06005 [Xanthobacteraceae bacterium]
MDHDPGDTETRGFAPHPIVLTDAKPEVPLPETPEPSEPPKDEPPPSRMKRFLLRTESEFSFFKGLTFLGVLLGFFGTLIGSYFQYLSTYRDKVETLAKDDLKAATQTFADSSNQLSVPLTLQQRLVLAFFEAQAEGASPNEKAYLAASAHQMIDKYEQAYTALRQNIDLLAQQLEMDLDWPSDLGRDAAKSGPPAVDIVTSSLSRAPSSSVFSSTLGDANFDCDKTLPEFVGDKSRLLVTLKNGDSFYIDWNSGKHNALAIYYCFNLLHHEMEPVRQWAASSAVDDKKLKAFVASEDAVQVRLNKQVLRFNTFMTVAMSEIERIRVKYRPNGFSCSVPGVRELIEHFKKRGCGPVPTAE